jgi:hypothetical protein
MGWDADECVEGSKMEGRCRFAEDLEKGWHVSAGDVAQGGSY